MATPKSRFLRILCAVGLAVAAAAVARPASVSEMDDCPAIDPPMVFVPSAGVRVFIDPVTGKIRPPTPDERRKAAETARDRSAHAYPLVIRPDGTRDVELDDAFLMSVVGKVNKDGTVSYRCVTGKTAAAPASTEESK